MPDEFQIVITGDGEVRDADGNLLNQTDPEPAERDTTEGDNR